MQLHTEIIFNVLYRCIVFIYHLLPAKSSQDRNKREHGPGRMARKNTTAKNSARGQSRDRDRDQDRSEQDREYTSKEKKQTGAWSD